MGACESLDIDEIDEFLECVFQKYGYDFRNYSKAMIRRRIQRRIDTLKMDSLAEFSSAVQKDEVLFSQLVADFSINTTEMFRDPTFYKAFRESVVPRLKTFPFIKIWHAGCSTGEEAYSLAILLRECGLAGKTVTYATDFNELVLKKAKAGRYPIRHIKDYTANYYKSGGKDEFSDYYKRQNEDVILDPSLRNEITFTNHNLVTDGVFTEAHVILCRNVLIYFNSELQDKVFDLFQKTLIRNGFLCLGSKETLALSAHKNHFEVFDPNEKIYLCRKRDYGGQS